MSHERGESSDLLRHSDITEGDSHVDRHESRDKHGLAPGYLSQPMTSPRSGRRAVKFLRLLSRLALLSLAAAIFVGLTGMYGGSVHPSVPTLIGQAAREHRLSAPQ